MEWWLSLIEKNGWPTAIVIAGVAVMVASAFATRSGVRALCAWSKPHAEHLVAKWIEFFDSHIATNEANTKANEQHARATAAQTPLITATAEGVQHLVQETDDDDGRISNVAANRKLDDLASAEQLRTQAEIEVLEGFIEHHHQDEALRRRLQGAIAILRRGQP